MHVEIGINHDLNSSAAKVVIEIERGTGTPEIVKLPVADWPGMVAAARAGLSNFTAFVQARHAPAAAWTLGEFVNAMSATITLGAP